jgi:hypothetical protein
MARVFSLLPGFSKAICSGVFIGENAHKSRGPGLHLQGKCSSAVHIPIEDLSAETRALLERVNESGDIFIDGHIGYRISRLPGRRLSEILSDPSIFWSNVTQDDQWSNDMEEIVAMRKLPERDPWVE